LFAVSNNTKLEAPQTKVEQINPGGLLEQPSEGIGPFFQANFFHTAPAPSFQAGSYSG
jgi:hypothetical protein